MGGSSGVVEVAGLSVSVIGGWTRGGGGREGRWIWRSGGGGGGVFVLLLPL